jgi:hypothetical protein
MGLLAGEITGICCGTTLSQIDVRSGYPQELASANRFMPENLDSPDRSARPARVAASGDLSVNRDVAGVAGYFAARWLDSRAE